jgi:hypothetical protein
MSTETVETLLRELVEVERYRLAAECTGRYQQIVMRLDGDLLLQKKALDDKDWASETIATLHAYVDLCAEELRLWQARQIPEKVWRSWEEGICAGFRIPAVAQLWSNFFKDGPYDELRKYLQSQGLCE